jgi:hypothetical protein
MERNYRLGDGRLLLGADSLEQSDPTRSFPRCLDVDQSASHSLALGNNAPPLQISAATRDFIARFRVRRPLSALDLVGFLDVPPLAFSFAAHLAPSL